LTADARDMAEAVRAAGKIAERNVPVVLRYEDGQVTAQVPQNGEVAMTQAFSAALKGASRLRVGFNPVFLSSLLDGFTGQVSVGFTDSDGASQQAATLHQQGDTFMPVLMTQRLS
jgi:DNA polymerase-3 subunit beta